MQLPRKYEAQLKKKRKKREKLVAQVQAKNPTNCKMHNN